MSMTVNESTVLPIGVNSEKSALGEKTLNSCCHGVCLFRPKQRPGIGFHRSQAQRRAQRISAMSVRNDRPVGNTSLLHARGHRRWWSRRCKKEHTGAVLCCTIRRGTTERGWEDEDS